MVKKQEIDAILKSKLVDIEWYNKKYNLSHKTTIAAVKHYCQSGWKEGKDPNQYFHTSWYITEYSLEENECPLVHYITNWKENKYNPSPSFSASKYLETNPDVQESKAEPLLHYVLHGRSEGRKAMSLEIKNIEDSQLVDLEWYNKTYELSFKSTSEAVKHYYQQGWKDGKNPNEFFDSSWYVREYNLDENDCPLVHYITNWKEDNLNPSPSFSNSKYLETYPDVLENEIDPLLHYILHGKAEGRESFPFLSKSVESITLENGRYLIEGCLPVAKIDHLEIFLVGTKEDHSCLIKNITFYEKPYRSIKFSVYLSNEFTIFDLANLQLKVVNSEQSVFLEFSQALCPTSMGKYTLFSLVDLLSDSKNAQKSAVNCENSKLQLSPLFLKKGHVRGSINFTTEKRQIFSCRDKVSIKLKDREFAHALPRERGAIQILGKTYYIKTFFSFPLENTINSGELSLTLCDTTINTDFAADISERFKGFIEVCTISGKKVTIAGWCIDYQAVYKPCKLSLKLFSEGNEIVSDEISPSIVRKDLEKLLNGQYTVGFNVEFDLIHDINPETLELLITYDDKYELKKVSSFKVETIEKETTETAQKALPQPEDEINGSVDNVTGNHLAGWARNRHNNLSPVLLDLFLDGKHISTVWANRFRPDLALHFNDHGYHSYVFEIPPNLNTTKAVTVEVKPRIGKSSISNKVEQISPKVAGLHIESILL